MLGDTISGVKMVLLFSQLLLYRLWYLLFSNNMISNNNAVLIIQETIRDYCLFSAHWSPIGVSNIKKCILVVECWKFFFTYLWSFSKPKKFKLCCSFFGDCSFFIKNKFYFLNHLERIIYLFFVLLLLFSSILDGIWCIQTPS